MSIQRKNEALEKYHITIVKEESDKPLDEHEMGPQEVLINGFNNSKPAFVIYGVSRRKWEGLGYSQKNF